MHYLRRMVHCPYHRCELLFSAIFSYLSYPEYCSDEYDDDDASSAFHHYFNFHLCKVLQCCFSGYFWHFTVAFIGVIYFVRLD